MRQITNKMSSKPIPIENSYTTEVKHIDKDEWYEIINNFSDANIFQTRAYDEVRCGEKNISRIVLRDSDKIIAAAQARIVSIPILGMGAAYVRWGPIWQIRKQTTDPFVFRLAIRALRNEYVCRRKLILRIFPILYEDNSDLYVNILLKEGYTCSYERNRGRTLILDIRPPIEELRKKLDQKWRNCLNRAERNQLDVIEGTEDSLFGEFIGIYQDLLRRKKFPEPNDINEFRRIQRELPNEFKMRIFLIRSSGFSSTGAICSAIGETGVYLFGATNDRGMADKGSYLAQWKAIQWMKNRGCRYYNLYGINPITNPGTYHFKAGLAGKNGKDVYYLGSFDCYPGAINAALAHTADFVIPIMGKINSFFRSIIRYK